MTNTNKNFLGRKARNLAGDDKEIEIELPEKEIKSQ